MIDHKKRNAFINGLIILLPTLITIFLLLLAFRFINNNVANPIGYSIITIINFTPFTIDEVYIPLWSSIIGFPITIIIIYLVGYGTGTLFGKRVFKGVESWIMHNSPVIKEVYPYAKQFIDTFISPDKKTEFKSVVSIEFPLKGTYAIGFVTAEGLKDLRTHTGRKIITVFVPTSPAPFTGFTLFAPEDEVIRLNMTIDEAVRIIMSGGVIVPPHQKTEDNNKTS
ncbi:MAG: DUF502 domain-containing protein [Planctomycetota bacterium]